MAERMKIRIGIAQTLNSTDIDKNFQSIRALLNRFEHADVSLVLFPECSLSGFSAKMRECTTSVLQPYFDIVQAWTDRTGIEVALPTAMVEEGRVYNSGRWFKVGGHVPFYKIGLTESEKKFFSVPTSPHQKVFEIGGFKLAMLICAEAQHSPWTYFESAQADVILWPGYWGWTSDSDWGPEKEPGKPNLIHANAKEWRLPILQSNFAFNDLEDQRGAGPEGLSFVIGAANQLIHRGPHKKEDGFVVELLKDDDLTEVVSCELLS